MRVLIKRKFVLLILFVLFLLFAGIFAITQEAEGRSGVDDPDWEEVDSITLLIDEDEGVIEVFSQWLPPGPPRWFRSNAGGMTLAETPSRLAALRNKYALVIDYVAPNEIDPRLERFYQNDYTVEIRILYERGQESRKQWLFRDEEDIIRLNAVFRPPAQETPPELTEEIFNEEILNEEQVDDEPLDELVNEIVPETIVEAPIEEESGSSDEDTIAQTGFIEIYNETSQIIEDRRLFENDSEIITIYFYNQNILVKAETRESSPGGVPLHLYTDTYRYNRSYSLRFVERLYHAEVANEPIRLSFPQRILDAASDANFMSEQLFFSSDFFDSLSAGAGFRMIYDTDNRGRIITQTMLDENDEAVWSLYNTWLGDRISSSLRTEGDDKKLIEYEYNDAGEIIVQRDINNGILERQVRFDGDKETEELFMNGVVVLRAYWENGRKIREERVRRQ